MKAVALLMIVMVLVLNACSTGDTSNPTPDLDTAAAAELQARAFVRACNDVICAGAPIYAPDSTPEPVRVALLQYTDEIEYLSESEAAERYSTDGRFDHGGTMIGVEDVRTTERNDVSGVNVSISKGQYDFVGRTYLFLWNGTQWVDSSPDAVSVTVTSAIS